METILLPLEHRGNTHLTFAEPVREVADAGISVVMTHAAWLLMGGPAEIAVTVKPDPSKEIVTT